MDELMQVISWMQDAPLLFWISAGVIGLLFVKSLFSPGSRDSGVHIWLGGDSDGGCDGGGD